MYASYTTQQLDSRCREFSCYISIFNLSPFLFILSETFITLVTSVKIDSKAFIWTIRWYLLKLEEEHLPFILIVGCIKQLPYFFDNSCITLIKPVLTKGIKILFLASLSQLSKLSFVLVIKHFDPSFLIGIESLDDFSLTSFQQTKDVFIFLIHSSYLFCICSLLT